MSKRNRHKNKNTKAKSYNGTLLGDFLNEKTRKQLKQLQAQQKKDGKKKTHKETI